MKTLQLLPLCFLLLSTFLGDVQTEFEDFKCEENITAGTGEDINIICINNKKIIDMTVKFCINKTLCPNSSEISTFKNRTSADNGRIALKINNNSAILHISSVQISDQRTYNFFLVSSNGLKEKSVALWVLDPVPITTQRAVTKSPVFEKFKSNDPISEETYYSTITLVPIFMLMAFVLSCALYWRRKKGATSYLGEVLHPDVDHQARFPEFFLRLKRSDSSVFNMKKRRQDLSVKYLYQDINMETIPQYSIDIQRGF